MAMDLMMTPTIAPIRTSTNTMTRTPDSDTETPPPPPQPQPKRVYQNHHHGPPGVAVVCYRECMKNHAASIGGHALDGCCEFMPGPTLNPSDPTSLKCAACGCHRNFHRRDPDDPAPLHHHLPTARGQPSPPAASHLLLSLSHSPSRPSDHDPNPTTIIAWQNGHSQSSKKRNRTKFSQEQKEKMYEFSEKIGWRLKKGEEKLVEDFCKEVGVVRGVFKVWMHNNKHSSSKREKEPHHDVHINGGTNLNDDYNGTSVFYANGAQGQERHDEID